MPKIIETTVYQFDELSDEAKERALERLYDLNIDYEWWDCIYDDASNINCKITGFDLSRASYCKLEFYDYAQEIAKKIIANHEESCETFKTAENFKSEYKALVLKYSVIEDSECEFDNDSEELEKEFRKSLSEDYRIILQQEYDYRTSEKAIIETIKINEYDFTIDGNLF